MARIANWKHAADVITFGEKVAGSPVEADLAQIERACREIAFCELAEAMARSRIVALRGALSGCRAEVAAQPGSEDLRMAEQTLVQELASFEETLPIECAYRADQRDIALARLTDAQARLRRNLNTRDDVSDAQIAAALALAPGMVVQDARQQAVSRLAAL